MPGCTDSGVVILLIDVSGMFSAVEFEAFVALNIKKSNAPSPLVVPLVILIVGGHNSLTISPVSFTAPQ